VPEAAPLEFHPFLADRFAEAVVPACTVLVVDHDPRPLERLLDRLEKTDAKWLKVAKARESVKAAAKAVQNLPKGELPENLIASHDLVYDPHTTREVVKRPPEWAGRVNDIVADLCVSTAKTSGWNPTFLAKTDDGETLDAFVASAKELAPTAMAWYGKLAGGMVAWMQGGPVRGWLARAEVPLLRAALQADEAAMFKWKERGGDFHRRKVQAFCFLAEKHGVGLATIERSRVPGGAEPK
jgi:hypothetical protein